MAMAQGTIENIQVSRALPEEYPVILNNMPTAWFQSFPSQVHLQVARMVDTNRFLIAHIDRTLVGGVGWQDDVALGAFYVKFLFVKQEYQEQAVAHLLMREVVSIAQDSGQRALFGDLPPDSSLLKTLDRITGVRQIARIDDFHEDGIPSIIYKFEMRDALHYFQHVERVIAESKNQ